MICVSKSR